MLPEFISFAFSITNVHHGFAEVAGLARASKYGLILEFETKYLGLLKLGVKEVGISISEIESVNLKEGWLKTEMVVKARSLRTLTEIPGSHQGQIKLRIPRKEKETAKHAASMLMLHISEREMDKLKQESDQLADGNLSEAKTKLLH